MTTIAIPIEEKIQVELEKYAKEQNLTTEQILERIVTQFILEERMKAFRKIMQPLAEKAGYFSEEDILTMS
ncbi:MAG: hypothetical protein JNL70_07255 [Saprospiraceae bacterium]|nr:hypothetical protein [Saprospiraceae bacterium]